MKSSVELVLICLIIFELPTLTYGQEIDIVNKVAVFVDAVDDLGYFNGNFHILSRDKIITFSKDGSYQKEEKSINTRGITIDKESGEFTIVDESGEIKKLNGPKLLKIDADKQNNEVQRKLKFIAVTDSGYLTYINAGWSSRISLFDHSGKELISIFSPGIGKMSGLLFNNESIWIVSDLGKNKNGFLKRYDLRDDSIVEKEAFEIPIKQPKGLTTDAHNTFFTYSEETNEIISFKPKK